MEFYNGYIINPLEFRTGSLYISPFNSDYISKNQELWSKSYINSNPVIKFEHKELSVTESATKALELALNDLNLNPEDEVWIITTSGNRYISGCVTRTIEMFCKWKREKTDKTAVILVNHEFGFLYRDIDRLKEYNLPIIEDKAYSLYSFFEDNEKNFTGNYIIYSMAKMFPMQSGGLLYAKNKTLIQNDLLPQAIKYYKTCFKQYNYQREEICKKRVNNYLALTQTFENNGFNVRFPLKPKEIPGAFLFCASGINLDELKSFLQRQGIECSVFYGEEAFYLPCHQNMGITHINYIETLIKAFLKYNNSNKKSC